MRDDITMTPLQGKHPYLRVVTAIRGSRACRLRMECTAE